jgi:transposase
LECLRPDVQVKRRAFLSRVRRIPTDKLVFLDESGMNLAMSRTHAWVKRGYEFIERVPINWGKNLTVLGAIRLSGWVALTTMFATANKQRFVRWLKAILLPKLRPGDVLVMDNLSAHHDDRVTAACAARDVRLLYLPPYSPDLNPIEPGWALQKQYVRRYAPRHAAALRRIARRARYRVTARHCRGWFEHAGYSVQLR